MYCIQTPSFAVDDGDDPALVSFVEDIEAVDTRKAAEVDDAADADNGFVGDLNLLEFSNSDNSISYIESKHLFMNNIIKYDKHESSMKDI